jgi:hypothetical protein
MKTIKALLLGALVMGAMLIPEQSKAHTRVVVKVRPPAPRVVVRPVPRHPGHVWVSGHWRWHRGRFVWVKGRWVRPRPGYVWVDGHWRHTRRGWVWVPGRWKRI